MIDKRVILEIACFSYESAVIAEKAGADRIEFCKNYTSGGLTPDTGDLIKIKNNIKTPVFVMIRPREGNFVYTDGEFEQMKNEIVAVKNLGFEGVVLGILNEKNEVDVMRNKILRELSKPMEVTFHRAFDDVGDQFKALNQLISIGINRILTSGKEKTAAEGIQRIKELKQFANGNITVLPGGGIRSTNIKKIMESRVNEIHSSGMIKGTINTDEILSIRKNILLYFENTK